MNQTFKKAMEDAKDRGKAQALKACTMILPLAVYNALMVGAPDMEYKQMGDIAVDIVANLLETLADANENKTFPEEIEHAMNFVADRMEITDRIKEVTR